MSNMVRWVIAVVLVLFGIGAAVIAVFGGAFSTAGCLQSPPDWVYTILIGAGVINLLSAVVPAVLLIRKTAWKWIALALVLGIVFSCGSYGVYLYLLGQNC